MVHVIADKDRSSDLEVCAIILVADYALNSWHISDKRDKYYICKTDAGHHNPSCVQLYVYSEIFTEQIEQATFQLLCSKLSRLIQHSVAYYSLMFILSRLF